MNTSSAFFGRILRVNLSDGRTWVDEPPVSFFRQYLGGAIGVYYLFNLASPGIDPLGPENVLSFVPSLLAHLPVGAFSRMVITAKSPLTGAVIDAQAGGYWSRECKAAGFDAIIIEGCASEPVYLLVKDGKAEIRSAKFCWGMETGPAEEAIKAEVGRPRLRSCIIGPGGENRVRFACAVNNLRHFSGRGGLGAVMGSKNLKAVAVLGSPSTTPSHMDGDRVSQLLKTINQNYADDEFINTILTPFGTHWAVWFNQQHGKLPTRNFHDGVFAEAGRMDHQAMSKHEMHQPSEGCFACRVRCKRSVLLEQGPIPIEKRYGGAEYETLGGFGSLLGIGDLVYIEKANELCSRYTLDSISCGATIAWAVDCYQKGILTQEDTGGLELKWGDGEMLLRLIEMIAHRQGFGDLLAEGSRRASERFGPQAEDLAAHCKGMEWPVVDPRMDSMQALAYAVCPTGADHMTTGGPDCGPEFWELEAPVGEGISTELVRSYYYQRMLGSVIDGLGICRFLAGATGLDKTIQLLQASLGWPSSTWELMRAGERRLTLYRAFNAREGFTLREDVLPPRAFIPLQGGRKAGSKVDPAGLERGVKAYYALCGWDPDTGWPSETKRLEMDLQWMLDGTTRPFPVADERQSPG